MTDHEARSPIAQYLQELFDRHADVNDGEVASYIPELAKANPHWFGICLVTVDGTIYEVGDTRQQFTIQSISKPFTFGAALEEIGSAEVRKHVGVEPTGEAFNSITLAPGTGIPLNPMVNAGAITAAGLVAAKHPDDAIQHLLRVYGRFAGRDLTIDEAVFESERATGHRNRAIAHLLRGSGALPVEPDDALDVYFRQCSVDVDSRDLGIMAATLANGGANPVTHKRAASRTTVRNMLTVMASCGMYDGAGEWLYTVGLPAKSGVGGGIIAVLPGQLGLAVFSPLLDEHGNSERGVRVCRDFSREMELHVMQAGHHVVSPIRSIYTLAQLGSKRQRSHATATELAKLGHEAVVLELQGDLDFHAGEIITRRLAEAAHDPRFAILDFHRVNEIHTAIARLLVHGDEQFQAREGSLVFSGLGDDHESFIGQFHEESKRAGHAVPPMFADLDLALEWCENQIASAAQLDLGEDRVELHQHEALRGLDDDQLARFTALVEARHYPQGSTVVDAEHPGIELLLVMAGELSVNLVLSDGGTHRLATLAPGMLVGEMLLASHEPSVTAVQADTDVDCLALTGDAIARLRIDDHDLWSALLVNVVSIVGRRADKIRHELVLLAE